MSIYTHNQKQIDFIEGCVFEYSFDAGNDDALPDQKFIDQLNHPATFFYLAPFTAQ
jgi:hypothetical protein